MANDKDELMPGMNSKHQLSNPDFQQKAIPVFLFCFSLIINLLILSQYLNSPFAQGLIDDADVYWKWGQRIAAGDWMGKAIFHQSPLYPYFLSLIVLLFGKTLLPVYLVQAVLSASSTILIYSITKKISDSMLVGFSAGVLFALYGMQVFYSTKILSECLSIFLMLAAVRLLLSGMDSKTKSFFAGMFFGLLLFAKPQLMIATPLLILYFYIVKGNRRSFLTATCSFLLPMIILVTIVAVRNYTVEKDFILITSNGGENFFIGNNEKANGVYSPIEGVSADIVYQNEDAIAVAQQKTGRTLKRSGVSSYWFHQGLNFIAQHPMKYMKLEWMKCKWMFSGMAYSMMYDLRFERQHFTKSFGIPFINFYMLFPVFIVGIFITLSQWKRHFLLYVFLIVNMANILLFFYDIRYMLLAMPFWIIFAAVALGRLLEIVKMKNFRRVWNRSFIIGLFIFCCASVLIYKNDSKKETLDWHLYTNLGDVNLKLNNLDAAFNAYEKAINLRGTNWMPLLGICKVYFQKGEKEVAAQLYNGAFPNLDPDTKKLAMRDSDLEPIRQYIASNDLEGKRRLQPPASLLQNR
jgi:4-amino-4-deoxy-L-arabinose transferase-like glycosyltransferase